MAGNNTMHITLHAISRRRFYRVISYLINIFTSGGATQVYNSSSIYGGSPSNVDCKKPKFDYMFIRHVLIIRYPFMQCLDAVNAITLATGNSNVHAMQLDLSSMDSVRRFAAKFDEQG